MNVLSIRAQPNDTEINCGGTLLRYGEQGHQVFPALMTTGNIGSNVLASREQTARTREAEHPEAARFYDAQVRFLRFDDQGLFDTPETRRSLLNAMRWADRDVILTRYPGDPSTDHNTTVQPVGRVILCLPVKNVPADAPPIFKHPSRFYWDTPAGHHFGPELHVDITGTFERKPQAVSCHKSQFAWLSVFHPHELPERCRIQAQFRGLQNAIEYAEGFRICCTHGYMPDLTRLPPSP